MDPFFPVSLSPGKAAFGTRPDRQAQLMQKAKELETSFLSEMLSHAGLDANAEASFGGGLGEERFASFLREAQAGLIVDRGGIGLAEALFRAMGGQVEEGPSHE